MKRLLGLTTVLALGLSLAQPSWAIMITEGPDNGTNVGSVDTLLDTAQLKNSGGAELSWLESLLPGATILPQDQNVTYYDTNQANGYAFRSTRPRTTS